MPRNDQLLSDLNRRRGISRFESRERGIETGIVRVGPACLRQLELPRRFGVPFGCREDDARLKVNLTRGIVANAFERLHGAGRVARFARRLREVQRKIRLLEMHAVALPIMRRRIAKLLLVKRGLA